MNGDYLIELTLAVYRISDDWSGSNFLKPQIRNLANEILIDFILLSRSKEGSLDIGPVFFKKIQDIQDCFNQARGKKLIDRNQFLLFQKEYNRVKEETKRKKEFISKTSKKKEPEKVIKAEEPKETSFLEGLSKRQRKILEILKKQEKVQVWQFKESFSDISKRTIRRDLEQLLKKDLIKRQGEWNEVVYFLK